MVLDTMGVAVVVEGLRYDWLAVEEWAEEVLVVAVAVVSILLGGLCRPPYPFETFVQSCLETRSPWQYPGLNRP